MSKLNSVIADPGVQQRVLGTAKKSTVVIYNPCPSAQFNLSEKFVVYKPLTSDGTGAVTGGAWKQVVQEQGCGTNRILNVLAFVQGPKTLTTTPLLPGTTHADPQLQKDAVRYAVIAVGGAEKNCNIGYIADTEFLQHEGVPLEGAKGAPWQELWTLISCTKQSQVLMHFTPDRTGTSIFATQSETRTFPLISKQ
jgi:hypothetical protein